MLESQPVNSICSLQMWQNKWKETYKDKTEKNNWSVGGSETAVWHNPPDPRKNWQ